VRLLNPTTALSEYCQEISQNLTQKNSCNSPKKAMASSASFREPQIFHKFCEALDSNGCIVEGLSGDFTKFNAEQLSQQSQKTSTQSFHPCAINSSQTATCCCFIITIRQYVMLLLRSRSAFRALGFITLGSRLNYPATPEVFQCRSTCIRVSFAFVWNCHLSPPEPSKEI
jgi:hypothetical protein